MTTNFTELSQQIREYSSQQFFNCYNKGMIGHEELYNVLSNLKFRYGHELFQLKKCFSWDFQVAYQCTDRIILYFDVRRYSYQMKRLFTLIIPHDNLKEEITLNSKQAMMKPSELYPESIIKFSTKDTKEW